MTYCNPHSRVTFVVRFGLTNLTRPEMIVESTRKYIHPRYNEVQAGVQPDDIAMVGMDKEIPFSRKYISSINY
jgi:hypothetical protein